jgi:nitroreductase
MVDEEKGLAEYLSTLAKRRKTLRQFSSRPVDWTDVIVAIQAACQAPSGANAQPWRFLIVTDPLTKRRIREACEQAEHAFYSTVKGAVRDWLLQRGLNWRKPFLEDAPLLLLVFSEKQAPYSTPSVWLAIGYLLLVVEALGLGTVTYTPSSTEGILDVLGVPEGFRLEGILPIGFPAEEKTKEPRLDCKAVTYLNAWGALLPSRSHASARPRPSEIGSPPRL